MNHSKGYSSYFSDFEGQIWLNAASEGPLPILSQQALKEAVNWKSRPYLLDNDKFIQTPLKLKAALGELFNLNSQDIILANSTSYGLHLLANGLPWKKGDEILLMQNDFPTDILPWLALEKKGVKVKQLKPRNVVLAPQELEKAITPKTKLFCISHVHTFSGLKLDIEGFSEICRRNKIICVINLTQSAGTMPLDISKLDVDAIVCAGYKWLCGPYGTGMAWFKPSLREQLDINQVHWYASLSAKELQLENKLKHHGTSSARKYDVFGTANFFNFVPWESSIRLLLEIGIEKVGDHQQNLITHLLKGLDKKSFKLLSSADPLHRSSLVVISHKNPSHNPAIVKKLFSKNIHVAQWKGNIRITPHVYNSTEEIDQFLKILHKS